MRRRCDTIPQNFWPREGYRPHRLPWGFMGQGDMTKAGMLGNGRYHEQGQPGLGQHTRTLATLRDDRHYGVPRILPEHPHQTRHGRHFV